MALNKSKTAKNSLGGGGLKKLSITPCNKAGKPLRKPIEALFNPSAINLSRSVRWEQQHTASQGANPITTIEQDFRYIEAQTLNIELFFDTYENREETTLQRTATVLVPVNPFQSPTGSDVREYTKHIAELAKLGRELHYPPICHLKWGVFDIFVGVLTSLEQRFTLFLPDGTPVRATLSCSFSEFRTKPRYDEELHSSDVTKTRTVRRHETLHSLAAQEYNDPSLWRHIAKANGIINPRDVRPGMVLTIPKLQR
jgi:nucleoid-associated protein YgaU